MLQGTKSIADVNIGVYDAIFLAGGQSPIVTMIDDTDLHTFVASAYEADKVVAVVLPRHLHPAKDQAVERRSAWGR